ncbi:MAG: shikimate kinase [Planctomycetota bacterium]
MSGAGHAPRLALVGLRGVGKSAVGRELAALVGAPFVDLDDEVVPHQAAGDVLARVGVEEFRRLELAALERVLADRSALVLAAGGGLVETPAARARLAGEVRCAWLDASDDVLGARIAADATRRPALLGDDPLAEIAQLRALRAELYAAVSVVRVEAHPGEPVEVARRVLRALSTHDDAKG